MATSTLDPDNAPEPGRSLGRGHGTDALGPSDTSDTGSDMQAGVHGIDEPDIGLDKGTNEDPDTHTISVDGDTDAVGTGERATAGRDDDIEMGGDIGVDRIDYINPEEDPDYVEDPAAAPRRAPVDTRPPHQR
jgi:hypothetical protein